MALLSLLSGGSDEIEIRDSVNRGGGGNTGRGNCRTEWLIQENDLSN